MKAPARSAFLVLVCIFMLGSVSVPLPALAQAPVGEGQAPASGEIRLESSDDLESPAADYYLWMAGSAFQPRNTSVSYDYVGAGCITSNTGGSALNQSFTASFRVPDGSIIHGVRFYYYDVSPQDSMLSITSYDGAGGFTDHVFAYSSGAAGAGNVYAALSTPYTVDTATRGFVFNWYPAVAGTAMQLCGARLFYSPPAAAPKAVSPDVAGALAPLAAPAVSSDSAPAGEPGSSESPQALPLPAQPAVDNRSGLSDVTTPDSPAAADYHFLAGSSFNRRDSLTTYQYGNSGCIYATRGGSNLFTIDLNMPDGARVYGARFYYYDTNASRSITFYLTDYTGLGGYRDLLSGASNTNSGFGSVYISMGASYDQYQVDQANRSLNAIAIGPDSSSLQLCGVRVFYDATASTQPPAGEQSTPAAGIAGALLDTATPLMATGLPSRSFAQDLQLPQGASARGLRVYYYNLRAPNGSVETWNYTGASADYLGVTTTTGHSGYSSTYSEFTTPYVVDHSSANLGVVPWLPYNPTYRFCGVRVFYYEGAIGRYRFIAGSAFHPRNSNTRFSYEGVGCIAVTSSALFLPVVLRSNP